jgi:biopolymer transport protein ExbB
MNLQRLLRLQRGARILIILIIFVSFHVSTPLSSPAQAQETESATPAVEASEEEMDLFTLLWKGGWVMIPIALASVLALTITIERLLSLRKKRIMPPGFLSGLRALFQKEKVDAEMSAHYCKQHPCVLGNLIESGLPKIPLGEKPLQQALEDAGAREVDRMKRSLKPLSMIATVAPLLGLLGTVYGMIGAFQAATNAGVGKSDVLAQGIYEALVTTAAGLTLAIPVIIVYQLLNNRVDAMVDDLDSSAEEFMALALNSETR